MKDLKKAVVAEFYRDFDAMEYAEIAEYLTSSRGFAVGTSETADELRSAAWNDYAQELGLEFHDDTLMQFGDGGYPYLYIVPADGGDTCCYECATKALKKGEAVGWMHHMEGEVEHCDCGAEIVPFNSDASYVEYAVTLKLRVRSDGAAPDGWDWADLLDLAPGESCDIEVIGEEGLLSSQKITGGPDPDDDPVQRWGEMPLKE